MDQNGFQKPDSEVISWDGEKHGPKKTKTETVTLNIGGTRIQTFLTTLERFKDSPLARIAQYLRRTDGIGTEIFMDRNPACFGAVIDYCRSGELHYPPSVCGSMFRSELQYWGIPDRQMQKCCVNEYIRAIENGSKLRKFTKYIAEAARMRLKVCRTDKTRTAYWRQVIWKTMMFPTYSRPAAIYNTAAIILLILNVVVILVQSVQTIHPDPIQRNVTNATVNDTDGLSEKDDVRTSMAQDANCAQLFGNIFVDPTAQVLFWADVIFSLIFTSELLVRCFVAPTPMRILKSISTHIEFLSLIPFYLLLFVIVHLYRFGHCPSTNARVVRTLFILRVVRVFRLCFVLRHYCTFRAFMYTLRSSLRELTILFVLVTFTTIITGTIVSLLESAYAPIEEHSEFENILAGLWWALITTTTVGYGDLVPASPPARFLTVFVALSGIVVIALATPMVSNNFNLIYTYLVGNEILVGPNDFCGEEFVCYNSPENNAVTPQKNDSDAKSKEEIEMTVKS